VAVGKKKKEGCAGDSATSFKIITYPTVLDLSFMLSAKTLVSFENVHLIDEGKGWQTL